MFALAILVAIKCQYVAFITVSLQALSTRLRSRCSQIKRTEPGTLPILFNHLVNLKAALKVY